MMLNKLKKEFILILKSLLVAESQEIVHKIFESSISELETSTQWLLKDYFNGMSLKELSQKYQMPENELKNWIHQAKRSLVEKLRGRCRIPQ